MLIKKYENSLEGYLKFYKFFYRFRYLFLSILIFAFVVTGTLCSLKGVVIDTVAIKDVSYGEKLEYQSMGIMSDYIDYEFRSINSDEWVKEEPYKAGKYEIRGISENIFGTHSYGSPKEFSINPLEVDVKSTDDLSYYGETPNLDFGLINGDRIIAADFTYSNLNDEKASVSLKKESIKVINAMNEDVSSCYDFKLNSSYNITLLPREVTFKGDGEFEYDGNRHYVEDLSIAQGSLYEGDYWKIKNNPGEINAGNHNLDIELEFFNSTGQNVTEYYDYSFSGALKINKREITIKTGDFKKVYDGKVSVDNTNFTITEGSLVNGDRLEATLPSYVDAGNYKNEPKVTIRNSKNEVVNNNYLINFDAGDYIIEPRPLTIRYTFHDREYDGHNGYSVSTEGISGLLNSHYFENYFNDDIDATHVGTYTKDIVEIHVFDENQNEITHNYAITVNGNDWQVTKRKITISTISIITGYTGNPQGFPLFKITNGSLAETDSITVESYTKVTDIGTYDNNVEFKITHKYAGLVNYDYDINYDFGRIIVAENVNTLPGDQIDDSWEGFVDSDFTDPDDPGGDGNGGGDKPGGDIEDIIDTDEGLNYGGGNSLNSASSTNPILKYTPTKSGSSFFKSTSFGRYNGKSWDSAPRYNPKFGVNPQEFISILLDGKTTELAGNLNYYALNSRNSDLVPIYPILHKVQQVDTHSIISDLKTKDIFVEGYNFNYLEDHRLIDNAEFKDPNVIKEMEEYSKFVDENYRGVESKTFDALIPYLEEHDLIHRKDPITLANKLIDFYESEFTYATSNIEAANSSNPLVSFFTDTHVGKCDYFAGAATLVFRINSLPARMVGGYKINGESVGKTYDVIPFQKHATTEVFIEGKGWVEFEFTVAPVDPNEALPPIDGNDEGGTNGTGDTSLGEGGSQTGEAPKEGIVFNSDSRTFEYDGSSHSYEEYFLQGEFKDGDYLSATSWSMISKVGVIQNDAELMIYDRNNNSVIEKYNLQKNLGKLTMTKKDLYITTPDITISTGEDADQYESGGLVSGDRIIGILVFSNQFNKPGKYVNIIKIDMILNEKGENVTSCYNIIYDYGTVTVI